MKTREAVNLIAVSIAAVVATFVVFFGFVILLAVLNDPGAVPLPEGRPVEDLQGALHLG